MVFHFCKTVQRTKNVTEFIGCFSVFIFCSCFLWSVRFSVSLSSTVRINEANVTWTSVVSWQICLHGVEIEKFSTWWASFLLFRFALESSAIFPNNENVLLYAFCCASLKISKLGKPVECWPYPTHYNRHYMWHSCHHGTINDTVIINIPSVT